MLKHIYNNIVSLIENNPLILNDTHINTLLISIKKASEKYRHINFYAPDASHQIKEKLDEVDNLLQVMEDILAVAISQSSKELSAKCEHLTNQLQEKRAKLNRIQKVLPDGILDIKRAIYLSKQRTLSNDAAENKRLITAISTVQAFMADKNKQYVLATSSGKISAEHYLAKLEKLNWRANVEFYELLVPLLEQFKEASDLTSEGCLSLKCIQHALDKIPVTDSVSYSDFLSASGVELFEKLKDQDEPFFYMPSCDEYYHLDYQPLDDLAGTGGNCYGESLLVIYGLKRGWVKLFCPEPMLLNFQLDQSRRLAYGSKILDSTEIDVEAKPHKHYIEWREAKDLLLNNPKFNVGDMCGLQFSMTDKVKASKSFTAGHIAVVVKLDKQRCPFKYLVYEKDFGLFGVSEDLHLQWIVNKIASLYGGMNYGRVKLVKYGEVTEKTYSFLNKIQPLSKEKGFDALPYPFFKGEQSIYNDDTQKQEGTISQSITC